MRLNENTMIQYTIKDKDGQEIKATFTLEQIEGSVPNFYLAFRDSLTDLDDFDLDSSEIISREIVSDSDEDDLQ